MQSLLVIIFIGSLFGFARAIADEGSALDYSLAISLDTSEIDNLSLGDDPQVDKLAEKEFELELALDYTLNDHVYLFLVAGLVDETEKIKPVGIKNEASGLERKQLGVGVFFGEEIASELVLGRRDFVNASEWWIWWDEELDAISLDSAYGNFTTLIGIAEERWKEATFDDFIDPEIEGVRRIITSLSWEFAADQSLNFYYLGQEDNSNSHNIGDFEDFDKRDEADGDLSWRGVSYLGEFDFETMGEFEVELHYSRVSGDEIFYEFDDPVGGISEVIDKGESRITGSAAGYYLDWTPAQLGDWSFMIGMSRGEGDSNSGGNRDRTYRQNDLQGEDSVYGELYQPELSNLVVQALGVEWEVYEGVEITLRYFDYEQDVSSDQIAGVSIELDPTGLNSDLGSEIDLVVNIQTWKNLELELIAARFAAGKAYGVYENEISNLVAVEVTYEF